MDANVLRLFSARGKADPGVYSSTRFKILIINLIKNIQVKSQMQMGDAKKCVRSPLSLFTLLEICVNMRHYCECEQSATRFKPYYVMNFQ